MKIKATIIKILKAVASATAFFGNTGDRIKSDEKLTFRSTFKIVRADFKVRSLH